MIWLKGGRHKAESSGDVNKDVEGRIPHPLVSLMPFVVLAVSLTFIVRCFGADSLMGASQVALLFSASLAAAIATIGVALIGIGMALGYSTGWTAGAIISGAYFGDKISPLSDTTVLASSSNEVPLFEHIRYMLITTVPSICIACIGGAEGPACTADYFRGILITFYGDTSVNTGSEILNSLVQTHGMNGMLSTIFLIVCAASFGGVMAGSGMVASMTNALTKKITGRTATVGATVSTGIFSNMIAGDQFLSIILSSSLFKKLYKDKGYESRLLSRSVEDSATITSVLIPWNSCGMTQSTVLKVPTLEYLPYCIFNLLSPVVSVIVAATGYRIFKTTAKTENNTIV